MSRARDDFSILILAGGASRRLRRNKRLIHVDSQSLLARTVQLAHELGRPVFVLAAPEDEQLPRCSGVAILRDRQAHAGPLMALADASEALDAPLMVLAADHPRLSVQFLRELESAAASVPGAQAVVTRSERGLEPLLAVYRAGGLARLRSARDRGQRSLQSVLGEFTADELQLFDGRRRPELENLNRPEELEQLRVRAHEDRPA